MVHSADATTCEVQDVSERAGLPPGRYGEPPPRQRLVVTAVAVVVAGLFGAWLIWAGLSQAGPSVRATVVGLSTPGSHRALVRVELAGDPRRAVSCQVQALDSGGAIVGQTRVEASTGSSGRRVVTATVRTLDKARRAQTAGCRTGGGA
jgi:Domain of unknown function (DUF4307)